jgi:LuxR family transcriptional regulator, maltose regulon positive regulatory protein
LVKTVSGFPGHPDRDTRGGVVVRRELLERLNRDARVTEVSGPAGSGKSVLLRSWIDEAAFGGQAAQVSVQDADRDPRRFWTSVAEALRSTAAGSAIVRPVTAAPDPDGRSAFERLLADVGSLRERIWLVIDDLHVLGSAAVLGQLELMLTQAPAGLRFVLASRSDLRLDLHRLRLEGGLTEIRAASLQFSHDEARALLQAAGVVISESALALLHQRTEGWAAGLRLAALSLTGHPDPERFAAEFRGDDRTVAEYLLAEVLERQPEEARRLLRRTSVLERVSGPLADRLTGESGGEQILQELEQAGAFVTALDAGRSWFRYHRLFADLLELELRRTEPDELAAVHATAADWLAAHGYPLEAAGHAGAAEDWDRAGRLIADHGVDAALNGQAAAVRRLITSFPACVVTGDAELTAVAAAAELMRGSQEEGTRYLALAAAGAASVPADRRGRFDVVQAVLRLYLARQRGDLPAVTEEAGQLQSADWLGMAQLGFGDELRALSLISLGIAELWSLRIADAEAHLEQGIAVARRLERPFLEVQGLAHWGVAASFWSPVLAAERSSQAIELARRHGLSGEPLVSIAYPALAASLIWQGELDEAERWLKEAERALPSTTEPPTRMLEQLARGYLEIARGRAGAALSAVVAAERPPARPLVAAHPLATGVRSFLVHVLVRLGETAQASATLAETSEQERERPGMRTAAAALLLAQDNPQAASAALAPVLRQPTPPSHQVWLISAFLLEASARDAFGEREAAGRALERALDLAEPDGVVFPFQLHPRPELLERHARQGTGHRTLTTKIIGALTRRDPTGATASPLEHAPEQAYEQLPEPLSQAECRVLSLLQTSLSAPEIARELYVSVNTVRTHTRHLYDKLGAHRRLEAIDRARAIGLLAPALQRALARTSFAETVAQALPVLALSPGGQDAALFLRGTSSRKRRDLHQSILDSGRSRAGCAPSSKAAPARRLPPCTWRMAPLIVQSTVTRLAGDQQTLHFQ